MASLGSRRVVAAKSKGNIDAFPARSAPGLVNDVMIDNQTQLGTGTKMPASKILGRRWDEDAPPEELRRPKLRI